MFEYNVYMCVVLHLPEKKVHTERAEQSENSNYINSDTMKINSNEFIGLCDVAKETFFIYIFL